MESSIEDIVFLARSEHRVDALRSLGECPTTRDDLQAVTGASKATNQLEEEELRVVDDEKSTLSKLNDEGPFERFRMTADVPDLLPTRERPVPASCYFQRVAPVTGAILSKVRSGKDPC